MNLIPLLAANGDMSPIWLIVALIAFFFVLFLVIFLFSYGFLYIRAMLAGAHVGVLEIIGMRLRGVRPSTIVDCRIMAVKSGLPLSTPQLETHYLARGNVPKVVRALISASKANIVLDWNQACAIDLAGRDVEDAVRTSVNPRVIDCPDPSKGRQTLDAVAKDGIQVKARARVTVRSKLDRLVGGATEDTIIARVGEGIVSAIGSANSYQSVLENPDMISQKVLGRGLDSQTAFEILSIDIADVDVGENVSAKLRADQAEADLRMARAEAEKRRAMAVAREQEMQALVAENRAKVIEAEAEIPKATAQALREGNLGVMDYLKLKNVQADTKMRESIGGVSEETAPQ